MITERDLIHPNERKMLIPAVIVSVLIYIALILSIRSIAFIFTLLVLSFISHGLMLANIRINGIKLSQTQFPDISAKAELICENQWHQFHQEKAQKALVVWPKKIYPRYFFR